MVVMRVRGWTCMMALAGTAACRQPNPDWLGPATDAAASSTSETGDGDSGDASATDTTSSEPSPRECAPAPILGEGDCPDACSACEDGRCLVDCDEDDCENEDVACPAGWPCDFACTEDSACRQATLVCAPDRDCTVVCRSSEACRNATVVCGAGTCQVTCGNDDDVCRRLAVMCGASDATLTCASPSNASVVPSDAACACEAVGCDD